MDNSRSALDILHKLHDDIANMPALVDGSVEHPARYVAIDDVLGWVELALLAATEPVTNYSTAAHCPRCAICHTHDETCGQAVRRFFESSRLGPVMVVVGQVDTETIDLPCKPWPSDAPQPFDLLKEVLFLRAEVVRLESEAGTWESGFAKGRRFGQKKAIGERNQLRRALGALREQMEKQP